MTTNRIQITGGDDGQTGDPGDANHGRVDPAQACGGSDRSQVLEDYPHLAPEDIRAAIAYGAASPTLVRLPKTLRRSTLAGDQSAQGTSRNLRMVGTERVAGCPGLVRMMWLPVGEPLPIQVCGKRPQRPEAEAVERAASGDNSHFARGDRQRHMLFSTDWQARGAGQLRKDHAAGTLPGPLGPSAPADPAPGADVC